VTVDSLPRGRHFATGFVSAVAESCCGDVFMSGYFETRHSMLICVYIYIYISAAR
jgi:hypothetical protein